MGCAGGSGVGMPYGLVTALCRMLGTDPAQQVAGCLLLPTGMGNMGGQEILLLLHMGKKKKDS